MNVWFRRILNIVGLALGKLPDGPLSEDEKEIEDFVNDGNLRKVDQLLSDDPSLKDYRDLFETPLLVLAIQEEDLDMSGLLLSHGCDVNAADNEGETPLHHAVGFKNPAMVKLPLENGASPDIRVTVPDLPDSAATARTRRAPQSMTTRRSRRQASCLQPAA